MFLEYLVKAQMEKKCNFNKLLPRCWSFCTQSSLTRIAQLLSCYHKSALNWQKLGVFVKSKLFVWILTSATFLVRLLLTFLKKSLFIDMGFFLPEMSRNCMDRILIRKAAINGINERPFLQIPSHIIAFRDATKISWSNILNNF